ncbi:TPA: hNH endonuclease [Citrobacter braakii]
MTVYEMEGFLRGKCLPGDMKVNESNAQYLVRKFSELQSQNADMAVQLANAESKCWELAAENAGLKSFGDKLDEMHNDLNGEGTGIQGRAEVACQQVALEAAMEEFEAIKTPAADAFLAEVRAQGVEMFAASLKVVGGHEHPYSAVANEFAAQLRKGAAL